MNSDTKIVLEFDDFNIDGSLNDTLTARGVMKLLPITLNISREENVVRGPVDYFVLSRASDVSTEWVKGDIGWFGGQFMIFIDEEEKSINFDEGIIIGKIKENELERLKGLVGINKIILKQFYSASKKLIQIED